MSLNTVQLHWPYFNWHLMSSLIHLTLLAGWQKKHPAHKKSQPLFSKKSNVVFWKKNKGKNTRYAKNMTVEIVCMCVGYLVHVRSNIIQVMQQEKINTKAGND